MGFPGGNAWRRQGALGTPQVTVFLRHFTSLLVRNGNKIVIPGRLFRDYVFYWGSRAGMPGGGRERWGLRK